MPPPRQAENSKGFRSGNPLQIALKDHPNFSLNHYRTLTPKIGQPPLKKHASFSPLSPFAARLAERPPVFMLRGHQSPSQGRMICGQPRKRYTKIQQTKPDSRL
jgi:hypothetical protein